MLKAVLVIVGGLVVSYVVSMLWIEFLLWLPLGRKDQKRG